LSPSSYLVTRFVPSSCPVIELVPVPAWLPSLPPSPPRCQPAVSPRSGHQAGCQSQPSCRACPGPGLGVRPVAILSSNLVVAPAPASPPLVPALSPILPPSPAWFAWFGLDFGLWLGGRSVLLLAELRAVEFFVAAALCHQRGVGAAFYHSAVLDHQDEVCCSYC